MKKVKLVLVMHWDEKEQKWSEWELFIQDDPDIDLDDYFSKIYGKTNYEFKYVDNGDLASLDIRLII